MVGVGGQMYKSIIFINLISRSKKSKKKMLCMKLMCQ
jgi:hypothetical protein